VYDFGSNQTLAINTYAADGTTLANASSVVCTITLPDATVVTPTVTNVSTGIYNAPANTTQAGRYTVVWTSTSPNDERSDTYDVRTAASIALLSLQDARKALNFAKTLNNEELRDYMDATTRLIENYIGPVIPRAFTETLYGGSTLSLSNRPVTAVTSITGYLTGAWTITLSNVVFDSTTGIVQLNTRYGFYDQYTVVYTAGRGLTDDIAHAARVLLQHLWANQRNMMSGNPEAQGPGYGLGFTMPAAVRDALGPMRTPAVG
jgi:hypothetical protein